MFEAMRNMDTTTILSRLPFFPKIHSLALASPLHRTWTLTHLLNRQPVGLRHLILKPVAQFPILFEPAQPVDFWLDYLNSADDLELQNLRKLEMSLTSPSLSFDMSKPHIQTLSQSLVDLRLDGNYLCPKTITSVVAMFAQRPMDNRLKRLGINIESFSPAIIHLFATNLAGLEELDLMFRRMHTEIGTEYMPYPYGGRTRESAESPEASIFLLSGGLLHPTLIHRFLDL